MSIQYWSFPTIPIGPFDIRTYGLFVAMGILVGGVLVSRRNLRHGIPVAQTEMVVLGLVGAGFIGARLLWVVTNLGQIRGPLDVIAVWEGGLQLFGGLAAALLVAPLLIRRIAPQLRRHALDSAAMGLALGLAIGRLGCFSNGEHFGAVTAPSLGTVTYRGGVTVDGPFVVGESYWVVPLIESAYLLIILAVLLLVDRRVGPPPGALAGMFCMAYAVARFGSDFLREFDRTAYGLTGAQYLTFALFAVGGWLVWSSYRQHTLITVPEKESTVPVLT